MLKYVDYKICFKYHIKFIITWCSFRDIFGRFSSRSDDPELRCFLPFFTPFWSLVIFVKVAMVLAWVDGRSFLRRLSVMISSQSASDRFNSSLNFLIVSNESSKGSSSKLNRGSEISETDEFEIDVSVSFNRDSSWKMDGSGQAYNRGFSSS